MRILISGAIALPLFGGVVAAQSTQPSTEENSQASQLGKVIERLSIRAKWLRREFENIRCRKKPIYALRAQTERQCSRSKLAGNQGCVAPSICGTLVWLHARRLLPPLRSSGNAVQRREHGEPNLASLPF